MDIRLTHETRGICLSALSGSAVTSGSYESSVLWLTNTQIVILDSIHLWCFAGAVTNNVKCQRTALILAAATDLVVLPGQGGWWGSALGGGVWGIHSCLLAARWLPMPLPGTWLVAAHSPAGFLLGLLQGKTAQVHEWWGATAEIGLLFGAHSPQSG